MQKPDQNFEDMEKALSRLMPASVSENAQDRMDLMLEELAGDSKITRFDFKKSVKWFGAGGIAAALGLGVYVFIPQLHEPENSAKSLTISGQNDLAPELVYLSESDRVEGFSDEGLFVDSGGSAVRKVRIRVIEESQIRDEETGIVVVLTEPREEMYMVPVSTF